jgi:hypothetical protein
LRRNWTSGDHQEADLLADDLDGRGRRVVFQGQLGAGVLDPPSELVLADDLGRHPEGRPLEDAILAEDDPLVADGLPILVVDALFEDDGGLGILEPPRLDDDGDVHRVADEDDRAGLNLRQADVPRPLVGSGGDGVDRDALTDRRLGGAERVFARVGPAVGRDDQAGDGLPSVRREHPLQCVAQRGDRSVGLDAVELAGPGGEVGRGPRGRFEVVGEEVAAVAQGLQGRGQAPLDQGQSGRLAELVDRRSSPVGRDLEAGGEARRPGVVGVGVGELHALGVVEHQRQPRPDRLAPRRDQHGLDQHGRQRCEDRQPEGHQRDPPPSLEVPRLPSIEPPEQRHQRRDRHEQRDGPQALGQRRELQA